MSPTSSTQLMVDLTGLVVTVTLNFVLYIRNIIRMS